MATIPYRALTRRPAAWSIAAVVVVAGAGALGQSAGAGRPGAAPSGKPAKPATANAAKPALPVASDEPTGARPPAPFQPPSPRPAARNDATVRRASDDAEVLRLPTASASDSSANESAPTKAAAKFEGTPAPGLSIWLDAGGSSGEDLKFLWRQSRGAAVTMPRADAPRVQIAIPATATDLAFELLVAGRGGISRAELVVPLVLDEPSSAAGRDVLADAGDDQTAIVGHRVTLNAARSHPRDELAYRWIQIEGPKPANWHPVKWTCSFVPTEPGLYRFLLVVANGKVISEASEVKILVASKAPSELNPNAGEAAASVESIARRASGRIEGGSATATVLARDFEDVATRVALYRTYEDLFAEISKRLDASLPADDAGRSAWERELIDPLSSRILQAMRDEGMDLDREGTEQKPLSEAQKSRLSAIFRSAAKGCRTASVSTRASGGSVASDDKE